jgi:hypothetical protein
MIARVESAQAWVENVTYQMCNMKYKEQALKLAGYPYITVKKMALLTRK